DVRLLAEWMLRRWARENHVAPALRGTTRWHPVVLDEFQRIDAELAAAAREEAGAGRQTDGGAAEGGSGHGGSAAAGRSMESMEMDGQVGVQRGRRGRSPLRHYVPKRPRIVRLLAGTLRCDTAHAAVAGPHFRHVGKSAAGRVRVRNLRRPGR
ncbi:MAG: hypothetical protein D6725_02950, partial [Planctomycetota bacterium]